MLERAPDCDPVQTAPEWALLEYKNPSTAEKPIFQTAPYCDPVQTAPEWGLLEYRNSSTAEILYSRSLYSKGLLLVILYKRLQDVIFWNIKNPPQQKCYIAGAYIPEAPHCDPVQAVQNGVFWNMEIPPQQKFYIPEAYIPEGSLL